MNLCGKDVEKELINNYFGWIKKNIRPKSVQNGKLLVIIKINKISNAVKS